MARPERFELPTARFVAVYSIQLSYGRLSEPLIIFSFYFCVKLFVILKWRRERDSNPRGACHTYTISNRAPSTTRTPLLKELPEQDSNL